MSVIIHGLDMPKDGRKHTALLQFLEDGTCRGVVEYSQSYDSRSVKVFEVVPLPEGHGRLGDLDALADRCDSPHWCVWLNEIDDAPTIVPADVTDNYVGNKSEGGEADGN